jgi:hypothetical protein
VLETEVMTLLFLITTPVGTLAAVLVKPVTTAPEGMPVPESGWPTASAAGIVLIAVTVLLPRVVPTWKLVACRTPW